MNAPFKQRENIEMFLKGCEKYGLQAQDLFQVCANSFRESEIQAAVTYLVTVSGLRWREFY